MALPKFKSLDQIVSHWANSTPHNRAAVHKRQVLTYGELEDSVAKCARLLRDRNVRKGDRVGVFATPGHTYLILLLAISRIGAIYVGINPRYVASEIAHFISMTRPKLVFVEQLKMEPNRVSLVGQALKKTTKTCQLFTVAELADLRTDAPPLSASVAKPQDIAVIVFTSGSSGKPKGAALHHAGLLAAAREQSAKIDGERRTYLSNLPINHVGAIMNLTLGCLVAGGTLVFQSKFDPAQTLELIEKESISSWLQVPTMFALVSHHPNFASTNFASLKTIVIGGGAITEKTLAVLRTIGAHIFVEYGQTEIMSTIAYSPNGASDEVLLNTIGKFSNEFDVRIADENNNICPSGEVGEIQVRGEIVLKSYWGDEDQTASAFTSDCWLKTGDLACQRQDGHVVLIGRAREMIKTGGYNVYPREIEIVLEKHPCILEAVVFGVPDALYGETVNAMIQVRKEPKASPTSADLISFCRQHLASYKIPKKFTFQSELPRLTNGKIDRMQVQNQTRTPTK